MRRLAIITSHPIQYNAPFFKLLAKEAGISLKVFYTLGKNPSGITDKGFGKKIVWDIPLLDGYEYEFMLNTSPDPGTSHFKGIINPTLLASVAKFNPTHVLVYGWSFYSHLKVMRHFKNKAIIMFRGDSNLLDEQRGLKKVLRRLFLTFIYRYIDVALYVGKNNKDYFIKHGMSSRRLIFAPHAIDNTRFGIDEQYFHQAQLLRGELVIPPEHIVFLFTGKFEKKKNPLLLIKTFKELNADRTTLLLVGDGELDKELRKEAEGFSNIKFLPFQNQSRMPVVYRAGDVLILPSDGPNETWGLCVNEAMACGLPVIVSSKVGCAADLVMENKNGYVFRAGNKEDLVQKLSMFAKMGPAELNQYGRISRSIINGWSYTELVKSVKAAMQIE